MINLQVTQSKETLKNQIFGLFTDVAAYGTADEFTDILYGKYDVEEGLTFADDFQYWGIYYYLRDKVVPHKIAVWNAGLELMAMPFFKDLHINPDEFKNNLWLHDLSKFSWHESIGYSQWDFKTKSGSKRGFEYAWHHHKQHNEHHPEYWLEVGKGGEVTALAMPKIYVLEMVADWIGAGRTYGNELATWLPDNIGRFMWSKETAQLTKDILKELGFDIRWVSMADGNFQLFVYGDKKEPQES